MGTLKYTNEILMNAFINHESNSVNRVITDLCGHQNTDLMARLYAILDTLKIHYKPKQKTISDEDLIKAYKELNDVGEVVKLLYGNRSGNTYAYKRIRRLINKENM